MTSTQTANYKMARHLNTIRKLREFLPYDPDADSTWYLRGELAKTMSQNELEFVDGNDVDEKTTTVDYGKQYGHTYSAPPIIDHQTGKHNTEWDFDLFMQSANYWMVDDDELPPTLLFILVLEYQHRPTNLADDLKHIYQRPILASLLTDMIASIRWNGTHYGLGKGLINESCALLNILAKYGFTNFIKYVRNTIKRATIAVYTIIQAIKYHHFTCFQYLIQDHYIGHTYEFDGMIDTSIQYDNCDCLQYLVDTYASTQVGRNWEVVMGLCTAICGNAVKCTHYLYTMVCVQNKHHSTKFWKSMSDVLFTAVTDDHIQCVRYMFEHIDHLHQNIEESETNPIYKEKLQNKLIDAFIGIEYQPSLECLTYLHECHQWGWSEFAVECMIRHGDLDSVKYMYSVENNTNCNHGVLNHEKTLQYAKLAIINQNEQNEQILAWLFENGTLDITDTRVCQLSELAIINYSVKCLMCVHRAGCPITKSAIMSALINCNLACIKYLVDANLYVVDDYAYTAIINGDVLDYSCLACVKYVHESGQPLTVTTINRLANYNHYQCLQYAHKQGCPWDHTTTEIAAKKGSSQCLEYLLKHNCPVDPYIVEYTTNISCLMLLEQYRIPLTLFAKNRLSQHGYGL